MILLNKIENTLMSLVVYYYMGVTNMYILINIRIIFDIYEAIKLTMYIHPIKELIKRIYLMKYIILGTEIYLVCSFTYLIESNTNSHNSIN